MIPRKTNYQFLHNSMRATRLAYLNLARRMFCKKWAELRGNTPLRNLLRCVTSVVMNLFFGEGKYTLSHDQESVYKVLVTYRYVFVSVNACINCLRWF